MTPERWRQVKAAFHAVVALPTDQRAAHLAQACADDAEIRAEVESLLIADARAASLTAASTAAGLTVLEAGARLGPYEILSVLGAGGMGVVYAARDCTRDEVIALKTFRRSRAADVYRIKREFRSLADVAHPNLVCMYELVVESEQCFFTMELVTGSGAVDYVRAPATTPDVERARNLLRQLVSGLSELHFNGKLHRDIKPSNVLVTPEGRVVILDFGLISDVMLDDAQTDEVMAGTPVYLAPELYEGVVPSEASDWYAVGTTLYEALTGRLPFTGTLRELRHRKTTCDPAAPSLIDPSVPDDLNEICVGLLCRDPARRFSRRDILERLAGASPTERAPRPKPFRMKSAFVGRGRQLEALRNAFAAVRERRAVAVYVHGPSGIGKTTLAQHFLDELTGADTRVVVLRGRCYERESVPHKALDGIVDSLSSYLSSLPVSEAASLLPDDVGALARAFPVMLRVEAAARVSRHEGENRDPADQRRLAVLALRQLLANISERRPLVLQIDDLHWADADSALIIETLLGSEDAPPLLLVACLRTEEIASKPFLQRLISAGVSVDLPLEPMTDAEACDVIGALSSTDLSEASRLELAREAGGNPFLLEQLSRHLSEHDARATQTTFAEMLDHRLRGLPDEARRFVDVLAVCGRPMAPQLVYEAAGLTGDERPLVAILRADHLLRNSGSALRIELYHDRIRETVTTRLSATETRNIHRVLIDAVGARDADDAEGLFEHYRGADDREGASRQAVRAARKAHDALAFDRAARWYRSALELTPDSSHAIDWKQALAESLANAGRPHDAAEIYLDAARAAPRARHVDLQSRAADQFLIGGHIDRGLDVIRDVLAQVGMRYPRTRAASIASVLTRRIRLRWRGWTFTPRDASRIPAETLRRIDTCFAVGRGLMLVDHLLAADFSSRHVLLALRTGEPYRVACALAGETIRFGGDGGPAASRIADLHERSRKLAEMVNHPYPIALCTFAGGVAAFLAGEWRRAAAECDRALSLLRTQCIGATWETNFAQYFLLGSLLYQGELQEIGRHDLPALLAAARERRHLLYQTELCMRFILVWLAADDPDAVQQQADEAMRQWSQRGFHRQNYNYVLTSIQTALYRGRAEQAWQLLAQNWKAIERTLILRIQWTRLEASYARGRCALLMAATGRDVPSFLRIVRHEVRRMEREKMAWSNPLAQLLAAGMAHVENRPGDARDLLAAAIEGFERADMNLYAMIARRRLGALTGNGSGHELIRQANAWMTARGIRNPPRMARLIAPGFPDPDA